MRLLLNPETGVIHLNPPTGKCNIPTARKDEGPKPESISSIEASDLIAGVARGGPLTLLCEHCFDDGDEDARESVHNFR